MTELQTIFEEASAARAFPGGAVFLARGERTLAHAAWGTTAYDDLFSRPATTDTIYDLASLSKLWTMTAFLIAARENGVEPETSLARFFPQFASLPEISLLHLLHHNSGLSLHVQQLCDVPPEEWPQRIADAGLLFAPGERVRYTCTAFVLLGLVVEKLAGTSLDRFIDSRLVQPLGLKRTVYNAASHFDENEIAPTETDVATGKAWRGIVHDEASRALGGVAGNAGLFSTANDQAVFARMWLNNGVHEGCEIVHSSDIARALNEAVPAEGFGQAWSWHLDVSSWMSARAPVGTAGHLGFTGPSFFIAPATKHLCIVLNNRVYPTREGAARLRFHRRIAEYLFANA